MTAYKKAIVRLNFNGFDKEWMLQYAYTHIRDNWSPAAWKKELMYFLIDWYSHSESIRATTSGSTGTPKTIHLEKSYMIKSAQRSLEFFSLKPGNKVLLALPIKYIAAKMLVVRSITGKLDLYCIEPSANPLNPFTPPLLDFASFTPAQLAALLQTEPGKLFAESIKNILLGGSTIPASLEEKIQKLNTNVWHSYGMTETMSHIAMRKANGNDASPYFTPLPGVTLSATTEGCLQITDPSLGIFKLQTNDTVQFSKNGAFVVLGRKDNAIISGGIKLFPETLEQKIEPFIDLPFYITAQPDETYGEVTVLIIESEPWTETEVQALKKRLKEVLLPHEVPKEIDFLTPFSRTDSGKIIRSPID